MDTVDGLTDIELDAGTTSGTFKVPKDLDIEAVLNNLADEKNGAKLRGWSKLDE